VIKSPVCSACKRRCASHKIQVMNDNNFNPFMTVGAGERKIVPLGVSAQVLNGGTALVNPHAVGRFKKGSTGFILKNANLEAEKGCFLYLQVKTGYLARLNPNIVLNGMEGVKFTDLYDMPDWFWDSQDRRSLGLDD